MRAGSFTLLSCLITRGSMSHLLVAFLHNQNPKDHCQGKRARTSGSIREDLEVNGTQRAFEYIFNRSIRLDDGDFEIFRPESSSLSIVQMN
jgi:hypothetical protein